MYFIIIIYRHVFVTFLDLRCALWQRIQSHGFPTSYEHSIIIRGEKDWLQPEHHIAIENINRWTRISDRQANWDSRYCRMYPQIWAHRAAWLVPCDGYQRQGRYRRRWRDDFERGTERVGRFGTILPNPRYIRPPSSLDLRISLR